MSNKFINISDIIGLRSLNQNSFVILIAITVVLLSLAALSIYLYDPSWFSRRISRIKAVRSRIYVRNAMKNKQLQKAVRDSGFDYDVKQDIFYSLMNPWQRGYGYRRLYDELCAPLSLIVDSEPIYFYYDGRNWLIEFWKGQYGMTTGSEVGIYAKEGAKLDNPSAAVYESASNKDRLFISFNLIKNREKLFTRTDKHWWLTGFILGEFSQPSELNMQILITFKSNDMRDAFIKGLKKTGYKENEYFVSRKTVGVLFDKPHSEQPFTRTPFTDAITQEKNLFLCKSFVELTSSNERIGDKISVIANSSPELLLHVLNIGKTRKLFEQIKEE